MNIKYFLKGFFCIKSADSPAIALFASFVAIGALFKSIGLNIQESIFSTFLTYALPGSLIMAESLIVGASLLIISLQGIIYRHQDCLISHPLYQQ